MRHLLKNCSTVGRLRKNEVLIQININLMENVMKTGINCITVKQMQNLSSGKISNLYHVKWRGKATTTSTLEKAIEKLWSFKKSECVGICAGKSNEWIQGYIIGLVHGEFISEEESRLADRDLLR